MTERTAEETLLSCLMKAGKDDIHEAPIKTKRSGPWIELLVAIGADHTASVSLPAGAYEELIKRDSN